MKSRTKKKIRRSILTLIVTFIMVFTFCVPPISAVEAETETTAVGGLNSDFSEEKAQLEEARATAAQDEFIPVFIFFNNFDLEDVHDKMKKEDGIDHRDFEDEERFEKNIVPDLRTEAENTVTVARTGDPIAAAEEILEFKKVNTQQAYLGTKRSHVKDTVTALIDDFVASLDSAKVRVVFASSYVQYVQLDIRNDYIDYVVGRNVVESYGYFDNDMEFVSNLSDVTDSNKSRMNIGDFSSRYSGSGIVIGILESGAASSSGHYDGFNPNSPHLKQGMESGRIVWEPSCDTQSTPCLGSTTHPTYVASVAGGDPVTINGVTYSGVATGAKIIGTFFTLPNTLNGQIDFLINEGANIINCSFSARFYASWRYYCLVATYVDFASYNNGVLFVSSAGNDGETTTPYITPPGNSYNGITVGGAITIEEVKPPFEVWEESSYAQGNEYLTNKPDLVAAGAFVEIAKNFSQTEPHNGTSLAAPFVAGIAALVMQASPITISSPVRVKAIILAGANPDLIKETDDNFALEPFSGSQDNLLLYYKSGAGLVDSDVSTKIAKDGDFMVHSENYVWSEPDGSFSTVKSITIPPLAKLRVAMCFDKIERYRIADDEGYDTNIDLRFVNQDTGRVIAKSCSVYNNVEIVEFENTASGSIVKVDVQIATVSIHNNHGISTCAIAWDMRYPS